MYYGSSGPKPDRCLIANLFLGQDPVVTNQRLGLHFLFNERTNQAPKIAAGILSALEDLEKLTATIRPQLSIPWGRISAVTAEIRPHGIESYEAYTDGTHMG